MTGEVSGRFQGSALGSLRLRARVVADGYRGGPHRSHQRGAGLEFAGHRAYTPGDDLRWLDQRAVLRQDRLLIKQFETETDRHLQLVVDTSASMSYRSPAAKSSKLQHASLLAAAIAQIALQGGDRVGLSLLGSQENAVVAASSRPETARRVADALERVSPAGKVAESSVQLEGALARVAQRLRRGSLLILLSDLLELPESAAQTIAALGAGGRQLAVLQILDPMESNFELEGPVRLRSNESAMQVDTNASLSRSEYLRNMATLQRRMAEALVRQGGDFLQCNTLDEPLETIRELLKRTAGRSPA